jgi:hypothetical protein
MYYLDKILYSNWNWEAISAISFIILTICIITVTILIGIRQNKLQKNTLKLQLFEKRYNVYNAIIQSLTIVSNSDFSDYVLSGNTDPTDINKLIYNAKYNLNSASILSESLFNKNEHKKISNINVKFKEVTFLHFNIFKIYLQPNADKQELMKKYSVLYQKKILATNAIDIEKYDVLLKTECKEIYDDIIAFNNKISEYKSLIEETKILNDLDKYLLINEIDK